MAADSPSRPRVLFAIGGLGLGGSERQLMQLISELHPARLQATVLTFSSVCATEHRQRLKELGVEVIRVAPARGPRALRPIVSIPRVFKALRRIRPDVVYAWLEEASTTVTPAALSLRIPVAIARRNVCGSPAEANPLFRTAIRWAERRAEAVSGNSTAVIDEAERRGIPRERLHLVHNGHPLIEALPLPNHEIVALGYLANYRPEKGHLRLLDALELIQTRTPWRVDLAGSGPLHERIAEEVASRGLSSQVIVGGPVTDVPGFWAEHDVAVLLSDNEGSPNALIEAALLGRPLVGTNGGGTAEVIGTDGGILVSHNAADMANALTRLIEDPELRARLGRAAHQHSSAQYDLATFANGHLGVITAAFGAASS